MVMIPPQALIVVSSNEKVFKPCIAKYARDIYADRGMAHTLVKEVDCPCSRMDERVGLCFSCQRDFEKVELKLCCKREFAKYTAVGNAGNGLASKAQTNLQGCARNAYYYITFHSLFSRLLLLE
jgi:hypothetical protein